MGERTKYFTYNGLSHFQRDPQTLHFFTDTNRPVQATISIPARQVGAIREALNALVLVLEPGFKYRSSTGKGEIHYDRRADNKAESRNRFFTTIRKTDPDAVVGMDPTVSVSAKGILIEGLALNAEDMGTIFIPASSYTVSGDLIAGTSTIEVGPDLQEGLLEITAKEDLTICIGSSSPTASAEYVAPIHKDFVWGNRWKREVLQLQAASALANNTEAKFKRIDLYNVLRHLRLNKAEKGADASLRFILVKGLNPEIQIAPWGTKVVSPAGPFNGERSACIGFYEREKLVRLEPLLPYIDDVDVSFMGDAQPSFWTLSSNVVSYTYSVLGYSPLNWARGLLRDQKLRRDTPNPEGFDAVMSALTQDGCLQVSELVALTGLSQSVVRQALTRGIQVGQVAPNAGVNGYQSRTLLMDGNIEDLVFGSTNPRNGYKEESRAYQIVEQGRVDMQGKMHIKPTGAIDFARLDKVRQNGEITYKTEPVSVSQEKMFFQTEDPVFFPKLQVSETGMIAKPGCTCAYVKAVPKGICSHLQALWIAHCRENILGETTGQKSLAENLLIKIDDSNVGRGHRISIRGKRIIDEWGTMDDLNGGCPERRVRLYQRQEDASNAFMARITELEEQGFVNAS